MVGVNAALTAPWSEKGGEWMRTGGVGGAGKASV